MDCEVEAKELRSVQLGVAKYLGTINYIQIKVATKQLRSSYEQTEH